MTTHPTIPRGWRRLRTGTRIKVGDRVHYSRWYTFTFLHQQLFPVMSDETIIRRVAKKKGRK